MGIDIPKVPDTITLPEPDDSCGYLPQLARTTPMSKWPPSPVPAFVNQADVLRWPNYFSYLPALQVLQPHRALLAAQTPYLAYLSGRPYLAAQTGGDFWLDASRNDELGSLQRHSYARATAIAATNPWAYANARRYGFHHVVYLPLVIDTDAYAPGPAPRREVWRREIGGDFFVVMTARLDRKWKGSHIGLNAFARFAARHAGARLVIIGWGAHSDAAVAELDRLGLAGRYLSLPLSGKRKVVEYLRAADCVLDQFVIGYYGATALEAMAVGAPVIMRLARDQYDALCATGAPPVLDADSEDAVAEHLERLAADAAERQRVGAASRRWLVRNHGVDALGPRYVALLNATASGARLDFSSSPLVAPPGDDELDYHQAGLRSAPPFPQYDI
jgi:glycosyltransferase involved in cell wall biosynthesis